MQALTALMQIFYSLRGKLCKKSARPWSLGSSKNLFGNRVNFFSTPYHRITVTFSGFRIGKTTDLYPQRIYTITWFVTWFVTWFSI